MCVKLLDSPDDRAGGSENGTRIPFSEGPLVLRPPKAADEAWTRIWDAADAGFDQLLGRLSGPLNFRLLVMPTVVSRPCPACRLEGPPRTAARLPGPADQGPGRAGPAGHAGALKDVGRIVIVAVVLDIGVPGTRLPLGLPRTGADRGRRLRRRAVRPRSGARLTSSHPTCSASPAGRRFKSHR